jgi:hypothetical protein
MRADDNPPEANDDSPENLNIAQKSDASDPGREIMDDKAEGGKGKPRAGILSNRLNTSLGPSCA